MQQVKTNGNIHISAKWVNDKPTLTFKNAGDKTLKCDLRYEQANKPGTQSLQYFQLQSGALETVILRDGYGNYKSLYIQENGKDPTNISIEELRNMFDNDKLKGENIYAQSDNQQINSSLAQVEEEPKDNTQEDNVIPKLQEQITQLKQTIADRENQINNIKRQTFELSQENSELKMQLEMQTNVVSSDPEYVFREAAHYVLQTLLVQHENTVGGTPQDPKQVCKGIEAEIKRFEELHNVQMNYTLSIVKEDLTRVNDLIKFELSELSTSENQSEHLAKLVLSDEPPIDVQFPYLGELGKSHWNDLKTFATKVPQVIEEIQAILHRIVYQLLDGFSPYQAKEAKEEQMISNFYEEILPNILKMLDLELVPIEIGQTEADFRIHDIQGSQRGTFKRGVVADIVQHGIYRISDKQIIRKPVVIRGEPD